MRLQRSLLLLSVVIAVAEANWFENLSNQVDRPARAIYSQAAKVGVNLVRTGSNFASRAFNADSSSSSSGSSNEVQRTQRSENSSDQDYRSKCFASRGANLRKDPVLFFYSTAEHSPTTLGCHVTTKIELNSTEKDNQDYQYAGIGLEVERDYVQRELIDTGLYEGSLPTYFFVHGFMASWNSDNWMCNSKDMILNTSRANVFVVDWSGGSQPMLPIDYAAAVGNTQYVADLLAQFVELLTSCSDQVDAKNFHFIGHSLGAHISGFVGYSLRTLGRITGLDPAGPCFSSDQSGISSSDGSNASVDGFISSDRRRLSPQSADYVLALHTDTALFGLNENCAHIDVYVNGGHRQPMCTSMNPVDRLNALFNLDFKETLDFDITCAHSYCQNLIDTFMAGFQLIRGGSEKPTYNLEQERLPHFGEDKCFSMAYKCADWASYKAGECGFCLDNDDSCVYIGLNNQIQPKNLTTQEVSEKTNSKKRPEKSTKEDEVDEDNKSNEEDEDVDKNKETRGYEPPTECTLDQHFIKSDVKQPTCMFEYQVIVAANREALAKVSGLRKHYYYLNIPLDKTGLLVGANGNRQTSDRLVQVSHRIKRSSSAYYKLKNNYLSALKSLVGQKNLSSEEDLDFFTAMISFHQAQRNQCGDGNTAKEDGHQWQLCTPINNLQEALLWSSSKLQLGAVRWVSANYMSGSEYKQRIDNSYFFELDRTSARVQEREEIDESKRASLDELRPRKSKSKNVLQGVTDSLDCVTSFVDRSELGKAATNQKCYQSNQELKFAVRLKPRKLLKEMTR